MSSASLPSAVNSATVVHEAKPWPCLAIKTPELPDWKSIYVLLRPEKVLIVHIHLELLSNTIPYKEESQLLLLCTASLGRCRPGRGVIYRCIGDLVCSVWSRRLARREGAVSVLLNRAGKSQAKIILPLSACTTLHCSGHFSVKR